jgi:hypothetical protein
MTPTQQKKLVRQFNGQAFDFLMVARAQPNKPLKHFVVKD